MSLFMLAVSAFTMVGCIIMAMSAYRRINREAFVAWSISASLAFALSLRHLTEFLKSN